MACCPSRQIRTSANPLRPALFRGQSVEQDAAPSVYAEQQYDMLDLATLPDNYLPRTNYVPACGAEEHQARTPRVAWCEPGEDEPRKVTDYYRLIHREMISAAQPGGADDRQAPRSVARWRVADPRAVPHLGRIRMATVEPSIRSCCSGTRWAFGRPLLPRQRQGQPTFHP